MKQNKKIRQSLKRYIKEKENVANLLKMPKKRQFNFVHIMLTSGFFSVLEYPSLIITFTLINLAVRNLFHLCF